MIQTFYQLARNQPVKYFECFSQLCRVVLVFCLATTEQMFTLCNLQDAHLLPHHLHELVKVEFPVSVDVVLDDKAQHLPIDLRQVGSENADRLPTPIMGNYDSPPITSSPAHFKTK